MRTLGVDLRRTSADALVAKLAVQGQSARIVEAYQAWDSTYVQVLVETDWTETKLDDWLYNQADIDYMGTFEV